MPTLDWIGKKAVLNHHQEVPYRLLKCDSKLSVGDPGSGNLLVEGDNLLALKALLPYALAEYIEQRRAKTARGKVVEDVLFGWEHNNADSEYENKGNLSRIRLVRSESNHRCKNCRVIRENEGTRRETELMKGLYLVFAFRGLTVPCDFRLRCFQPLLEFS